MKTLKKDSAVWALKSLDKIQMTSLKSLTSFISPLQITGSIERPISGISFDSREIKKDNLFFAVRGLNSDGHLFIDQAVRNGATAVIGDSDINPNGKFTYIKVGDVREVLGKIASVWYGNPSTKLKVIGVTGTKGKTTTVHLIYYLLTRLGKKAGLVSSIAAKDGESETDTGFHVTNPDVISLNSFLNDMVKQRCEYAVVEVSSHGIDQKRIEGIKFAAGVLTNIAPEHLDYHKTFKEYKRVKTSFINSCPIKVFAPIQTELKVLPGEFNNLNAEAALEVLGELGFDRKKMTNLISGFELPEGRLEEIKSKGGFRVFIDFAHTTDSLKAVLKHLGTLPHKRIISVFGCASERDPGKRSGMSKVSADLADISIFTVEDSRFEDIYNIFKPMRQAALRKGKIKNKDFYEVPERGEAIALALSLARKGDIVGFFGKGHEKSLSYKGFEHPYNEHSAIESFLTRDLETSAIVLAAGKGTRMKSPFPKILHEICGRPMIAYSLENLRSAQVSEIIAVLSYKRNLVRRRIQGAVKIAVQSNPKGGTGNATKAGLKIVSKDAKNVMVLYGDDTAFYTSKTIKEVISLHKLQNSVVTFITLVKDNPTGLGRVLRDNKGNVKGLVEEKDATDEERKVKEINDGLYIFDRKWLKTNLSKVRKSKVTGEVYIIDLIKMAIDQRKKVIAHQLPDSREWQGINTPEELAKAEEKMSDKLNAK